MDEGLTGIDEKTLIKDRNRDMEPWKEQKGTWILKTIHYVSYYWF